MKIVEEKALLMDLVMFVQTQSFEETTVKLVNRIAEFGNKKFANVEAPETEGGK